MGPGDARNATRYGQIVAVCDVDAGHLAAAKKKFPEAEGYLRLPQAAGAQGRRRRDLRHGRSLAHAGLHGRDEGRQGRLLREAADADHRRGQAAGRGAAARPGASCRPAPSSAAACTSAWPATWSATAGSARSRRPRSGCPAGLRAGPVQDRGGARRVRLRLLDGPDAQGRLRQGAHALQLPLLVGVLRRHDDRLGRAPQRHRPVGAGHGRHAGRSASKASSWSR